MGGGGEAPLGGAQPHTHQDNLAREADCPFFVMAGRVPAMTERADPSPTTAYPDPHGDAWSYRYGTAGTSKVAASGIIPGARTIDTCRQRYVWAAVLGG